MKRLFAHASALLVLAWLGGACGEDPQSLGIDNGDETSVSDQALSTVTLTVRSRDLDKGNAEFTGMWTEILQNGKVIKSGFTPLVSTLNPGTYTARVSNYQNFIFDHWGNGSTNPSRTLSVTGNTTINAYYHSGITGGGGTGGTGGTGGAGGTGGGTGSTPTGTIWGLYSYPTSSAWNAVVTARTNHPTVPVIPVINPSSGPGSARDTNFVNGITKLKNAGCTVLGYVATGYTNRGLAAVQADIDKYASFYPQLGGIFFDEMANTAGHESFYSQASAYARSHGFAMTVGNPGTDTRASYIGTVNVLLIYESAGLPSLSLLGGWHLNFDRHNFGIIPYGVPSLDANFVRQAKPNVGYIYITNDGGSNPWDTLSSYFDPLLGVLAE